jgi:hypothetical protein
VSRTLIFSRRFSRWVQASRWIQCTRMHRIRRGARIHRTRDLHATTVVPVAPPDSAVSPHGRFPGGLGPVGDSGSIAQSPPASPNTPRSGRPVDGPPAVRGIVASTTNRRPRRSCTCHCTRNANLGYTRSTAEVHGVSARKSWPARRRAGPPGPGPAPLGIKKTDVMNTTDVGVFAGPDCGRAATAGAAVPTTGCSRPGCQRRPWPAPGRARGHGAHRKAALPR